MEGYNNFLEGFFNNILSYNVTNESLRELELLLTALNTENPEDWLNDKSLWDQQIVKAKIKKYLKRFATSDDVIKDKIPLYFNIIKKITFNVKKTQKTLIRLMKKHPGLRKIIYDESDNYSIWPWWTSMITYLNIASKMIDYLFRNNKRVLTFEELKDTYPKLEDDKLRNILMAINKAAIKDENWYTYICNDIHITQNVKYFNEVYLIQEGRDERNAPVHRKYENYIEKLSDIILTLLNQIYKYPAEVEQGFQYVNEENEFYVFLDRKRKHLYISREPEIENENFANEFTVKLRKRELIHWIVHEVMKCFTVLFRWKDLIGWVSMIDSFTSNSWRLDFESTQTENYLDEKINEFGGYESAESTE